MVVCIFLSINCFKLKLFSCRILLLWATASEEIPVFSSGCAGVGNFKLRILLMVLSKLSLHPNVKKYKLLDKRQILTMLGTSFGYNHFVDRTIL